MGEGVGSVYIVQTPLAGWRTSAAEEKKTAKRPETNKGGREEEEMRFGLASGCDPGRLRSAETGVRGGSLRAAPDL
jgi:hypothetical protein